jgi:hypothetical protein
MSHPKIVPIKNGVAAVGEGWAVFGPTEAVARERYLEAERQKRIIRTRAAATAPQPHASQLPTAPQA